MHESAAIKMATSSDSEPSLQARVRKHVHKLEGGVVSYKERPWMEPEWTREVMRQFYRHMRDHGARCMLLDLINGGRPNAECRQILWEGMGQLVDIERVVVATGGNALLNVALKFIFSRSFQGRVQVFRTMAEARHAVTHA
jgi:hypothetical protein